MLHRASGRDAERPALTRGRNRRYRSSMADTEASIPQRHGAGADIAFTRHGGAIDVRLTRPQAMNALTHAMARALHDGLAQWAMDSTITHVVISGTVSGKPVFCAGGDIRDLHAGGMTGTPRVAFFRDEYALNRAIGNFPKPFVALMDGPVMGGGAGLAMHGSHRVAGASLRFAMPETAIGLVPDVGGSFVLPRLPHGLGVFLGLSGVTIGQDDAAYAGLATHCAPPGTMESFREALLGTSDPDDVLAGLHANGTDGELQTRAAAIAGIVADGSVQDIVMRVDAAAQADPWFAKAAARLHAASPASLHLALELMRRGRSLSLTQCLENEFRCVCRCLRGTDLYEGIRAAIIDKTVPPAWSPASLDAVSDAWVEACFEPSPDGPLFADGIGRE
jgi:enoyl-CoA hydratase